MRKTIVTLAATTAIALGGLSVAPKPADAAWWIAPVIFGSVVGGAIAGGVVTATANDPFVTGEPFAYEPARGPAASGEIYVRPTGAPRTCFWARQQVPGGWQRVRVCD